VARPSAQDFSAEPGKKPGTGNAIQALSAAATVIVCLLHGYAVWCGLGGLTEITSEHPIARHDHPIYFHVARITPTFLRQSGTTAGYDPSFMAGYAKSIIFPASSTLVEVVFALGGRARPALAYKLYVLVTAAAIPWLVALTGWLWKLPASAVAWSVALFTVYVWSDFPMNYAEFGMLPYLVVIPLGLLAVVLVERYLDKGGSARWLAAAAACSLAVMIHFTCAMIVIPAAAATYLFAFACGSRDGRPLSVWRHAGIWAIPPIVLVANAFWWWPGIVLAATKGASDFAFAHPERMLDRLGKIFWGEPRIEAILVVGGVLGMLALARRAKPVAAALGTFMLAGFFWGYLAGAWRALDFLQPGRHTYAFYTAAAIALGFGINHLVTYSRAWLGSASAVVLGLVLVVAGGYWLGGDFFNAVKFRVAGRYPFLSSRPSSRQRWVIDQVRTHVKSGERLLYEEGGFDLPGIPDPFRGGRYSGLLPYYQPGIEVLGGPYLHAALTTNHTQFGEGKLFGKTGWGREHFVETAKLYRPAAVLCWSPWSRRFCYENRDLIEILVDDGQFLFGRVNGFGGATIQGRAEVQARPGRLQVVVSPSELDGTVVLRYHFVPRLRSEPEVRLHPVQLAGDPVPFIGLKPPPGTWSIELEVVP
jgi:hypothetical protein